jgi:hypothetical protein
MVRSHGFEGREVEGLEGVIFSNDSSLVSRIETDSYCGSLLAQRISVTRY